jgi:hypothetical protein
MYSISSAAALSASEVERLCARRQLHGVTAEDENTEAVSVEVDEKNEIWKGGS